MVAHRHALKKQDIDAQEVLIIGEILVLKYVEMGVILAIMFVMMAIQ